MEEQVDVVDDHDNVMQSISKTDAHKEGLLHRTVISQYINRKREWVLVRQASDRQDAGQFVNPTGGHAQAGESEDEALKREALEEIGVDVVDFKLVGKKIFRRTVGWKDENHYFIVYEIYGENDPVLNEESVEWKRFTEDELTSELQQNPNMFGTAFHVVIDEFYPHLKS
jgi:isopentenyl-diphosphate delta-isomerase